MSCIATLYTVPSSAEADFARAKANEKREIVVNYLFIKRVKTVGGDKYLWEFLDEVSEKTTELNYSGWFVLDYLWTCLELPEGILQPVDDYFMKLPHDQARRLAALLQANPPDRAKLEDFWKGEHNGDVSNLNDNVDTLVDVHDTFRKWAAEITNQTFGVLHMSY